MTRLAALERVAEVLRSVEWAGTSEPLSNPRCPSCGAWKRWSGHAEGCALRAALAEVEAAPEVQPAMTARTAALEERCPIHNEKWIEGVPCPSCGGRRVWHDGLGLTTTDEHWKCLGCGKEGYADGIDS